MENSSRWLLKIKKRSVSEWMLYFVFFYPFLQAALTEWIGVPDIIKFLIDACLIYLLIEMFFHPSIYINKSLMPFFALVVIFLFYTLITYFFNFQSPFYYLWGLRNNFRFYVAFFAFVLLVQWDDVKKWFNALEFLYVINFFVILVQFFGGKEQDFLGGIFGVQRGCNGSLVLFLTIIVGKSILEFMRGEGKAIKCFIIAASSLLISAMSELKFFFVIFIIILLLSALMTKQSLKKLLFLIFSAIAIGFFASILSAWYKSFDSFLSFENLLNALVNPNYATDEDIGRFTAIPVISENFLQGFWDKLFGMGLGNADESSLAIFHTPFYDSYHTFHYSYFSYAMMFLETGFWGLVLYISFFIMTTVSSVVVYRKGIGEPMFCQLTTICSIVCIILTFYNSSLRSESAYFMFLILALPFISARRCTRI